MMLQTFLPLVQLIVAEQATSQVCIPDRDTAECELTRLRHEYGADLIKAVIRKDKSPKRAPKTATTYTLRYFVRYTKTVHLF